MKMKYIQVISQILFGPPKHVLVLPRREEYELTHALNKNLTREEIKASYMAVLLYGCAIWLYCKKQGFTCPLCTVPSGPL